MCIKDFPWSCISVSLLYMTKLLGGSSSVEMGWEWAQVPVAKQEIGKRAGSWRGAENKTVISISGINNPNIIDDF